VAQPHDLVVIPSDARDLVFFPPLEMTPQINALFSNNDTVLGKQRKKTEAPRHRGAGSLLEILYFNRSAFQSPRKP
jgi:hypothetical protein